jgi:hypothetical protein
MPMHLHLLCLLVLITAAACAQITAPTGRSAPTANDSRGTDATAGAVPVELIERMREDLARQIGDRARDATLVEAIAVEWPDGSLGCPEPGQMYTQALVPGYRVIFEAGGTTYAYHADRRGQWRLCRNPSPPATRDVM